MSKHTSLRGKAWYDIAQLTVGNYRVRGMSAERFPEVWRQICTTNPGLAKWILNNICELADAMADEYERHEARDAS